MRALDLLNQSSGTNTEGKKIRIEPDAQWIHLKEEKGVDLLPYNVFPGSILLKLGLYNDNDVSRQNNTSDQDVNDLSCAWENESNLATATPVDQCTVTVNMHIYSGRDLPPADQKTGALDSYLKCTLGGETKQTSVRYNSCNPTFFETLSFNLDVPRQRDLWPEIIVQIWDHDKGSMDDFIGNIVLSLSDAIGATKSSDKSVDGEEHGEDFHKSRPEWRKIFFQEPGDIKQGSFLISLEVLYDEDFLNLISPLSLSSNCEDTIFPFTQPLTGDKSKALTTNSFLPLGSEKKVEILVLGCHDLSSPSSFADLSSPFLSLKIGESTTAETFSSKKPSAENCNYNQKIIFDNVYLPDDAEFAPRLQITVFDKGGIFSMVSKGRTILGTGSCSLANTEFYKKMHEKSTKESFDDFPVMLNNTIPQEKGYRSNRTKTKEELEIEPIYETVGIFRGKRSKGPEPSSKYELQRVGKVNLLIRIFDDEFDTGEDLSRWDILLQEFLTPKRYNVRVYILKAIDLTPQDKNNKSDPFCKLRLTGGGKKTSWVKSQTKKKTLSPEFFERFDLSCKIPGKPTLEIKVLDEDKYSDDLIGLTTIQLDHRIFSKKWNSYGTKKPIERRFLKHPSSVHPQGSLKMWVDIIEYKDKKFPVWDITKPPDQEFEVRLVVWKVEGISAGDNFTNQSDLFVKVKLGAEEWQETDTHLFAKDGKGIFNYRIKFPLTLRDKGKVRGEESHKLKIEVWDADFLVNDMLCGTQIDMANAFKNAWITKDTGKGYEHFSDVEAQLQLATKLKAKRKEQDDENDLNDIPINWRGNPQGFLAGEAENCVSSTYDSFNSKNEDEEVGEKLEMNKLRKLSGENSALEMNDSAIHGNQNTSDNENGELKPLMDGNFIDDLEMQKNCHDNTNDDNAESANAIKEESEKMDKAFKLRADKKKKSENAKLRKDLMKTLDLDEPENSEWISFKRKCVRTGEDLFCDSKILLSIEILPKKLADKRRNGVGRAEPNIFPTLPDPPRIDLFKMLNPLYALKTVLGNDLAAVCGAGCCCCFSFAGFIACGMVLGPQLELLEFVLKIVPPFLKGIIVHVVLLAIAVGISICFYNSLKSEDGDDDDDDEEKNLDSEEGRNQKSFFHNYGSIS
eukprot:CAMPEP_0113313802 /NCGR_PEP_ID=MMETSP0010_2-20120614/10087_1 /TAXON_ID=216773 ORGANISM="Corethron hystrix, Strain 308" /NCGR_SAMPLE_ID=MMETSP0010_2 /ASSEMBLY_ACC=CAM_ASM_000155 /LENGTH=1130 /DNA_ID=CAMNT_0000169901 /DNA_START=32 /DNA_END=3424 /DNA_ORIENTATION=- /assembly_acc=CAM_ASM_000155